MSSTPLRFLGVAIVAWVGIRAVAPALALEPLKPIAVPPAMTALAPEPVEEIAAAVPPGTPPQPWSYGAPPMQPVAWPYPVAVPMSVPVQREVRYAEAAPAYFPPAQGSYYDPALPAVSDWPAPATEAPPAVAAPKVTPSFTPALRPGFDRLSLTSWALMRQNKGLVAVRGPVPLASSGQLGQSQAGARLTWRYNRALALNLRVSAPMERQEAAGEVALGVSYQPLQSVPVRLIAERRKAFGIDAGRNAFALLAEGGVYERPLPWNLRLDGYAQAGLVGLRTRDLFADGGVTVTRPFMRRFAVGGGVWGGVQPGLSRLDAGPRASMWLTPRIRAHVDYRLKLVGNARPGSGAALTVGANF